MIKLDKKVCQNCKQKRITTDETGLCILCRRKSFAGANEVKNFIPRNNHGKTIKSNTGDIESEGGMNFSYGLKDLKT